MGRTFLLFFTFYVVPPSVHGQVQISSMVSNPPLSGVNIPDLVWRAMDWKGSVNAAGLASSLSTINNACKPKLLSSSSYVDGIQSFYAVRFPILPYYPDALRPILLNATQHLLLLDTLFSALQVAGCGFVVPIIFPNPLAILDAFNENMVSFIAAAGNYSAGGGVSKAWDYSLAFLDALTTRYSSQNFIRAWELSSDFNYLWDVDQSKGCAACSPVNSTPASRGRSYNISTGQGIQVLKRWASRLRSKDVYLNRPISSGNSLPRPAAFHLEASFGGGVEDWAGDTFEEFASILSRQNEAMDWMSVHLYPGPSMLRPTWGSRLAQSPQQQLAGGGVAPSSAAFPMLLQLTALLSNQTLSGRLVPLYVGEYGAGPNINNSLPDYSLPPHYVTDVLAALEATAGGEDPISMPPPPAPGVRGMVNLAFLSHFEPYNYSASTSVLVSYAEGLSKWPGQQDGILAALGTLWAGNYSTAARSPQADALLSAVLAYNSLHTEPATVPIPGKCDTALFLPSWRYAQASMYGDALQCFSRIMSLTQTEFLPPPAFDIATVMCKGPCRRYSAAWFRLREAQRQSNCPCSPLGWPNASAVDPALTGLTNGGFLCPHSPHAELCRRLGLCYDEDTYENWTCSAGACGRWAESGDAYSSSRTGCRVNYDGAGQLLLSTPTLLLSLAFLLYVST